jgi:predicted ester cyclase
MMLIGVREAKIRPQPADPKNQVLIFRREFLLNILPAGSLFCLGCGNLSAWIGGQYTFHSNDGEFCQANGKRKEELPSNSTKPISREEAIEKAKRLHNAFPDISFSIEELIAVGDKVISRYIMRGTHQGEFAGIPATGNKVEISGIMIGRIENEKIVEEKEEMDMLGLFMQLGMELKPKEPERK